MKTLRPHSHMLSPAEVAAILGMSPSMLANWRCSGFGPPWARLGGSVRYDEAKLQRWIEAQERRPREQSEAKAQAEREIREAIKGRRPQQNHRFGRHKAKRDLAPETPK
jgi:predicted DNA-binding transcriptional regulator AlpA